MGTQVQADLKGSTRLGSYLRRLRTGYGYSLRRVEERARANGGEIDNSQLSRYEKGICYPSFDKLRVLAGVFNVSVQSFSDVVDLEAYEEFKPAAGEPRALIDEGTEAVRLGDTGRGFACYERALEFLADMPETNEQRDLAAEARVHLAAALRRLGKLSLAEQELRHSLRLADHLSPPLRTRALLALANIHADQGDNFLSELEAQRAFDLAQANGLDRMAAMALHTLAVFLSVQNRHSEAIERFSQSASIYGQCGEAFEALRVRINVGASYVALGKLREGVRVLKTALQEAEAGGYRRLQATAWCRLGKAYYEMKDLKLAKSCFTQSDSLASTGNAIDTDILFFNSYYEWKMATASDSPTRAKIAFGRLKVLRSGLERRVPEVGAFDDYVERGRSDA
jgi:tetratricopeptide (TPR) repeat protein